MVQSLGSKDEQTAELLEGWLRGGSDSDSTTSGLTKVLQRKTSSWPPAAGLGITLLKVASEVRRIDDFLFDLSERFCRHPSPCRTLDQKSTTSPPSPRDPSRGSTSSPRRCAGPCWSSTTTRCADCSACPLIAADIHHLHVQLSNNDLNKLLGLRWKALSDAEKEPFMRLAEQDRSRYTGEVEALHPANTQSGAAARLVRLQHS